MTAVNYQKRQKGEALISVKTQFGNMRGETNTLERSEYRLSVNTTVFRPAIDPVFICCLLSEADMIMDCIVSNGRPINVEEVDGSGRGMI
jgi:hypothetical protein